MKAANGEMESRQGEVGEYRPMVNDPQRHSQIRRARWTLRLLENKVVELGIVDRASDSTIGRALKKTLSSPIADSNGSFRRRPTARS
jgi:hypothetical protein